MKGRCEQRAVASDRSRTACRAQRAHHEGGEAALAQPLNDAVGILQLHAAQLQQSGIGCGHSWNRAWLGGVKAGATGCKPADALQPSRSKHMRLASVLPGPPPGCWHAW